MADTELLPEHASKLRWWREALTALVFYAMYSLVRNQFGSESVGAERAFDNALLVIRIEDSLNLFVEEAVQAFFLDHGLLLRLMNIFYGSLHFVVTPAVLVWLYRHRSEHYARWRNTLGFTSATALIGYASFPLMPPRLLNDFGVYGGRSAEFAFVDTLERFGGLWSFDTGSMAAVSNQFAAMPSLHLAFAVWCSWVVIPLVSRPWVKGLFVVYPLATVFVVVVTGNHYWIDGAAGAALLVVGRMLADASPVSRFRTSSEASSRQLAFRHAPRHGHRSS